MQRIPPHPLSNRKFAERPEKFKIYQLDDKGVLMYKIPYTERFDYYPVDISLYALSNYLLWFESGKKKYREVFLNNSLWLLENLEHKGDMALWLHRYTLPYGYNFRIPWVHGMAQALGASTLLRAYFITEEDEYREAVEGIVNSFKHTIQEGGVRIEEKGYVWFEEYAVIPPVHILNGFMFILVSLNEIGEYLNLSAAGELFNEGLRTLMENLPKYDTGYWSLYDLLHGYPAMENYHRLHIRQLKVLYGITGKEIFQEYARRWERYDRRANRFRARINRGFVHIRKLGPLGVIKRYLEIRRYNS